MKHNNIRENMNWKKRLWYFILSGVVYFVVTMPLRHFFSLMPVAEMRSAAVFPPIFGMIYGFWGALGCAVANLIADIGAGYSLSMSICSFPIHLLMGILPYLLWYCIPLRGEEKTSFPKMDTTVHMVKYMLIILVDSAVVTILLGLEMKAFGITEVFSKATFIMFLNNLDFCYVLGLPLFAFISFFRERHISLNERLILILLMLVLLAAFLTGVTSWREATHVSAEPQYLWNRIWTNVAVAINIFFLVEIVFLVYVERRITVPIEKLAHLANNYVQLGGEDLNSKDFIDGCAPYVKDQTEVGNLAKSYVRMITDLDDYMEHLTAVTAERERIGAELDVAKHIQASMLPSDFPAFPERNEFNVYATMTPAKEVGGDFYDFFMVDRTHLAVVMADVSGKGVPAALFMMIGKTLIKDHTKPGESLGDVFTDVNNLLCASNSEGMFITAFEGVLDLETGELRYVNAGHEIPYICRKNDNFEPHKVKAGFVLAGMEQMQYKEGSLQLEVGDRLFLYTDGVPEATNADNELYGSERLCQCLNLNKDTTPEVLLQRVEGDVDMFVGGAPQFDDITMLCLEYKGQYKKEGEA